MFKTVAKTVAGIFSVSMAKDFISKMATVRGEFQQLEMGFKTMLGSAEQADKLMSQLVRTAATTPFGMSDIAQASKQLLAYGVNAEEVNDTLIRLGDIAAGLSIPIGDLAYLYGTTMVQGRMFTQDLRQFTGRGIPMTEALAEVMGVAKDEVAGLVTAGKVGFNEMQQAIVHLTSEGSKFGGLMEAQSKTITGQLSNLEDAIEQMFNNIGKSTEGIISGAITQVSKLVENYEQVGKILFELIKIYGTYKAALIVLTVNHNLAAAAASGHTASELLLAKALNVVKVAQAKLNAVMAKNPYALMAAILTTIIYSSYRLIKAQKELTNAYGETSAKITSETQAMKALFDVARDENRSKKERAEAIDTINARYGDYLDNLIDEKASVEDLNAAYKELAASIANKYLTNLHSSLTEDLQADLADAETSLWSMVGKMATKSGLSANRQGAMTAEMQQWVSQYGKYNSTTEIYDKLTGIYNKYGGEKLSGSQRGRLFGFIEDWKEAGSELQAAEKSFESYKRGYEDTLSGLKTGTGESTQPTVFSTITDEITKAREELAKLKTEEQDLRKGIRPEGAKESFNFSSALAENAQQQKEVQERLANLTGASSKDTKKAEEEAKKNREAFIKEYGSYEMQLKRLDDEWTTTINSLGKDTPERALAEKQKTYALAAFSYDWLKDNSVDRDAIREALVKQLDAEIATLDGAAKEAAEARKKVTLAEFDTETGSSENEYLKAWGTMQEKRAAISKEYDDKILAAKDEWAKKSLEKEKLAALYDFDSKNSSEYQKFFTANLTMAKEEVEATAQRIKNGLNAQLRAGTITAEDFLNTWEKIEKQVKDVENATDDLMTYMSGGLDALFSSRQNLGWQMQSSGTIDYQKAAEMYEKALEDGNVEAENTALANMQSAEAMQSAGANMSAAAGQAASTVAVIDAIVHGINDMVNGIADTVDLISDMADAYGADTSVDSGWGKTKQFFSTFSEASQHATNAWDSLKSGNVGGVIKGVVGSWTSWFTSYAKYKDAKLDKKIQKDTEAIEGLQDAYDELGDAISDAFSSNAVKLIEEQNKNLEEQNELIRDQIAKEEKKKNTDKDAIEEYNKQIEENNKLIQKNKEAAIDAIFGEDVQSAISNFADYITDAWAKGNTAAEGAKDIVRSMMKSMVTESIKAYVQASGKMQEIRQAMQDALADGIISDEEDRYIEQLSERLAKDVEKQYGWSNKYYQSDSERGTTSGGITSMSQESADELNGRFTAIQGHTYQINENVELLKEQHLMLVSNTGAILSHVMGIHSDTSDIRAVQQEMRDTLAEVRSIAKSTSDDILLKGIKIK